MTISNWLLKLVWLAQTGLSLSLKLVLPGSNWFSLGMSREDGSNSNWFFLVVGQTGSSSFKLVFTSCECQEKMVQTGYELVLPCCWNWLWLSQTGCWNWLWLAQTGLSLSLKLVLPGSNWFSLGMSREDGSNWLWTGSSLLLKLAVTSSNWLLKLAVTSSNWFFVVIETSSNWFVQTGFYWLWMSREDGSNWHELVLPYCWNWLLAQTGWPKLTIVNIKRRWFKLVLPCCWNWLWPNWFILVLCMTSKYISMEKDGWNWFFLFVQVQSDADNLAGCD